MLAECGLQFGPDFARLARSNDGLFAAAHESATGTSRSLIAVHALEICVSFRRNPEITPL